MDDGRLPSEKTKFTPHLTMLIVYRSTNKSYDCQVLLEGCKCMWKGKAMKTHIIKSLFDSDSDSNSDDEPILLFFVGFFLQFINITFFKTIKQNWNWKQNWKKKLLKKVNFFLKWFLRCFSFIFLLKWFLRCFPYNC